MRSGEKNVGFFGEKKARNTRAVELSSRARGRVLRARPQSYSAFFIKNWSQELSLTGFLL
jgi:hypothetical protein